MCVVRDNDCDCNDVLEFVERMEREGKTKGGRGEGEKQGLR